MYRQKHSPAGHILLLSFFVFFTACQKVELTEFPLPEIEAELIFQSGFEKSCRIVATRKQKIEEIVGADQTLHRRNDWIKDFDEHPNIGDFRIFYDGGNRTQRSADLMPDPADTTNTALRFWLAEPNVPGQTKGRVQADIYNNNGLKEIYQSVRIYFPASMEVLKQYPGRIWFFTLFELWNNRKWDDNAYPFKITLHLKKPDKAPGAPLYFGIDALKLVRESQEGVEEPEELWQQTNLQTPIPTSQWITLETYIREGNAETGRFYIAVTSEGGVREILFNIRGHTHHPKDPAPDGFSDFNPMKLYTSGEIIRFVKSQDVALEVYWDNYELWKNRRPELIGIDP